MTTNTYLKDLFRLLYPQLWKHLVSLTHYCRQEVYQIFCIWITCIRSCSGCFTFCLDIFLSTTEPVLHIEKCFCNGIPDLVLISVLIRISHASCWNNTESQWLYVIIVILCTFMCVACTGPHPYQRKRGRKTTNSSDVCWLSLGKWIAQDWRKLKTGSNCCLNSS